MASDAAGARANLSEASDTLAGMTNLKSHRSAELFRDDIVGDLAGDEAGVRANLSQAPDTLAGMAKSKSHQSDDKSWDEAKARFEAAVAVLAARGLGPHHVLPAGACGTASGASASDEYLDADDGSADVLPDGVDDLAAGPTLAAFLSTVDLSRLNGHDLVTVLRAGQRQVSHYQAVVYAAMAETAYAVSATTTERSALPNERAADEIAAALGYTRRKACNELNTALRLRDDLPEVAAALESGDIDGHKASVICDGTAALKLSAARGVAGKILVFASRLTVGQIGARLRRLCILEDPAHAQARYERSLERRRVVARPTADGTTHLHISDCAPHLAQAATDRVNRIARSLKTRHESRSVDQLRADVALDLLTGRLTDADTGEGKAGSVSLHVDLTTLAGLDDHPGELSGYGPVVSDIARQVAEEQQEKSGWNAVVSDPETGEPLHVVSVRRRPTTRQQKMIRALHPVCVFPGCRMPAVDCDLDHCVDYAFGGPTTVGNHAPLCRHHHMSKHQDGWRYAKTGRVGVDWVSPFGHTYRIGAGLAGERWTGGRDPP